MSDRAQTGGLSSALALLGAAGRDIPSSDGEQVDFFEAQESLALPLPRASEPTGRAGRPKGARNKSTQDWVEYLLSRYRSPLVSLAELATKSTGDLVDELQAMADRHRTWVETKDGGRYERALINPADILRMQRDAAVALLPYVHKKQPMSLEVESQTRGIVVLGSLETSGDGSDDDLAIGFVPDQSNQRVSDAVATPVGHDKSDGLGNLNDANEIEDAAR